MVTWYLTSVFLDCLIIMKILILLHIQKVGDRWVLQNNITSWSGKRRYLSFEGVNQVVIRVKMLSESSKYSIIVNQDKVRSTNMIAIGYIILIVLLSLIWIIALIIWYISIWWCLKRSKTRIIEMERKHNHVDLYLFNQKRINLTMTFMENGTYFEVTNPYAFETWVIWLEKFSSNWIISITNEWKHVFHTLWLRNWYTNIKMNKSLRWPICKTINKPMHIHNDKLSLNDSSLTHLRIIINRNNENIPNPIYLQSDSL